MRTRGTRRPLAGPRRVGPRDIAEADAGHHPAHQLLQGGDALFQAVKQSGIIVVQCGTKFSPGRFVRRASNDFLYATTAGKVYFDQGGKRVNVLPDDATSALV